MQRLIMDENKVTEELYNCFNLIRSTAEGVIPYNNSLNVWNVPGGLKRVKKATFEILRNGLRISNSNSVEDPLKVCTFLRIEDKEWLAHKKQKMKKMFDDERVSLIVISG